MNEATVELRPRSLQLNHSRGRLPLRQVGDTFLPELIGGFAGHGLKGFQLKGVVLHEPVEFVDRARVVFVQPSESVG